MNTPIAILDAQSFQVLFTDAHPLKVSVRDEKSVTRFAVEDGSQRSDSAVKRPVEITIDFTLTDDIRNQYELMREAFLSNRLVVVQTRTANYPSMQIESLPNEQFFGAVMATMTLVEIEFVRPEYGALPPDAVRNGADSSTVERGQQTSETSSGSTLFRLLS